MRRLLILLVAAGCGGPSFGDGFLCGDADPACPPGTTCGQDGFCHAGGGPVADSAPPPPDTLAPDVAPTVYMVVAVADDYIRQAEPVEKHGGDDIMRIGSLTSVGHSNRGLLTFDLAAVAPCANVQAAGLAMYYFDDEHPVDVHLDLYPLLSEWNELETDWTLRDTATPWDAPGGDIESVPPVEVFLTHGSFGWVTWDVTDVVRRWLGSALFNAGVLVMEPEDPGIADQGRKYFHSREFADDTLRPFLTITCTN